LNTGHFRCFTFIFVLFGESRLQVAGAACQTAMSIMTRLGDLMQRIEDGRTGWILDDQTIGMSGDAVYDLYRTRRDEDHEFFS
jgi:hypothetical protein